MENIDMTSFILSDVQIEDGFEYGDWRDECMSGKLYEQVFNQKINLFDNQINTCFNEPQLSYDTKSDSKQASLEDYENNLNKIGMSNIPNGDSSDSLKSNNFLKSFESDKCEILDESLATTKARCARNNLHLRKDVVNKAIIRAFIRFYIKYFKFKILNWSRKTDDFLFTVLNQRVNRKIISLTSYQDSFTQIDDEFEELIVSIITWIICSTSMKAKLKEYFEQIEEVQILNDILSSYSHEKFERIYKYKAIKTLFEVFMAENGEQFLSNFSGLQRVRYEGELESIIESFDKQQ